MFPKLTYTRYFLVKTFTIITTVLLLGCFANAYAFCYEEAASLYGLDPEILKAISWVESRYNPYAINYNRNGSYDYGLMQINTYWYKILGTSRWKGLSDPCYNLKVGAWILSLCMSRYKKIEYALSCYHTGRVTPCGLRYARKILSLRKTDNQLPDSSLYSAKR